MISLTGLTALRITKLLAENGQLVISHFNKPLAIVMPYTEDDYIIMKRPTSKRELYQLCNQLESQLDETTNS